MEELKVFIEEEKIRKNLELDRKGELFLFYKADRIIVTDEITGIRGLLRQLNEDQISHLK